MFYVKYGELWVVYVQGCDMFMHSVAVGELLYG